MSSDSHRSRHRRIRSKCSRVQRKYNITVDIDTDDCRKLVTMCYEPGDAYESVRWFNRSKRLRRHSWRPRWCPRCPCRAAVRRWNAEAIQEPRSKDHCPTERV